MGLPTVINVDAPFIAQSCAEDAAAASAWEDCPGAPPEGTLRGADDSGEGAPIFGNLAAQTKSAGKYPVCLFYVRDNERLPPHGPYLAHSCTPRAFKGPNGPNS